MGELVCDRCHQERPDIEVFVAKGNLPSQIAEDRLRRALDVDGHTVGGFPKLCGSCQKQLAHLING